MTDHSPDDLDRKIRDLIGRAVAETPPSPRLDQGVLVTRTHTPTDRNRWIIGGLAGLSIAAVIVAIFLFSRPDEVADPLVPATQSTITIETPPPPPTPARATTPSTLPADTDPPTMPANTSPTTAPGTTAPPTIAPATIAPATIAPATIAPATIAPATATTVPATTPPPPERADVRLQAGPGGVEILGLEGRSITTEPMAVARVGPDDTVYAQRSIANDGDTTLLSIARDGHTSAIPLPDELSETIRLHDTAIVDGRWTLLIETQPVTCTNPIECIGGIWAYDPDNGSIDEIDSKIVWEGGWGQLSLSETGVIVGAEGEGPILMPYIRSLPGASGPIPELVTLGLEESYYDCSTCPRGFAINRIGDTVGWITPNEDGSALVSVSGVDGADATDGTIPAGIDFPLVEVLSIGTIEVADGFTRPIAVVNEDFRSSDGNPDAASFAPIYLDIEVGEVDLGTAGTIETYE